MSSKRHAVLLLCALAFACARGDSEPPDTRSAELSAGHCSKSLIPWGQGASAVGFIEGGQESASRGAMAVALASADTTMVLDNVNRRILRFTADGDLGLFSDGVDQTTEDLSVGTGGAVVSYSPVTRSARVYTAEGEVVGEVTAPTTLRHINSVELGASLQVRATSALQEQFTLGSPNAPMAAEAILRSGREGAVLTDDGRGVVALVRDGIGELRLLEQRLGERASIAAQMTVPGRIAALHIVGAVGTIVCARVTELGGSPGEVDVTRRLLCGDVATNRWIHERPLADVGSYMPRRELALWGDGRRMVSLQAIADEDGLMLSRCEVQL